MLLEKLLRLPGDSPQLHLRDAVYGCAGRVQLVREVMGLANADTTGARHILFGVSKNDAGETELKGLRDGALEEMETYADLVNRYIEPALKLTPIFNTVKGVLVGGLEIARCNNPPYMIKTDVSNELRRGDCWLREGGLFRPAQRSDLDRMYRATAKNRPLESANNRVLVGLGREPTNTSLTKGLPDTSRPPSSSVAARMRKEIDAREAALSVNVEDTGLARLVHARLYGNDSPYEEQGINTLVEGYNTVMDNHQDEDNYYFFESHAVHFNLSMVNTGQEPLEDVSVLLMLPWAEQFRVAERLYPPPGQSMTAKESELLGYPRVKRYNNKVQVKQEIERLEPDQVVQVFEQELRVAVTPRLAGQKVALRYSVQAKGFDRPEEGRLKLVFDKS